VADPRAVRAPALGTARPATCPPPATIDTALRGLELLFRNEKDSDKRGAAIDGFNARFPTACLSTAQATRLLALSSTLAGQARKEEASFPSNPLAAVGAFLGLLVQPQTWIRVAEVGGGAILVYMGLKVVLRELGGPTLPSLPSPAGVAGKVSPALTGPMRVAG
jgi:hypothetical protein